MIVRWCKVWAIRWVDERFPALLRHHLSGTVCDVRSGIVVKNADGAGARPLAINMTGQTMQLLALQPRSDSGARWPQFKQE